MRQLPRQHCHAFAPAAVAGQLHVHVWRSCSAPVQCPCAVERLTVCTRCALQVFKGEWRLTDVAIKKFMQQVRLGIISCAASAVLSHQAVREVCRSRAALS